MLGCGPLFTGWHVDSLWDGLNPSLVAQEPVRLVSPPRSHSTMRTMRVVDLLIHSTPREPAWSLDMQLPRKLGPLHNQAQANLGFPSLADPRGKRSSREGLRAEAVP